MNRASDLLPWILGGLLMAAVAISITAGSISEKSRVRDLAAEPAPSLPAMSPAVAPATAPPIVEPAVLSQLARPSDAPQTMPSAVPSGQIWECTTRGVKTFSNNPCGDKSSLREVGPMNTMTSRPAFPYTEAYAPRYTPAYVNQNAYSDQDSYSEPASDETHGDVYPVIQGYAYLPQRVLHPHRPIHHKPGMPVRRN
jgi:hypothetical protein